jgi:hypothetical protein
MNSKQDSGDIPLWVVLIIVFGVIAVGFILYLYPTLGLNNNDTNNKTNIENIIEEMEINKIVIYGLTTCSYCQKEYSEFGEYGILAIDKGVFVFCDDKNNKQEFLNGCSDVKIVPTWKMSGEVVGVGYYELEKSVNILLNKTLQNVS